MKRVPPPEMRQLRAQMALKNITLKEVSRLSGVAYTVCSQVLSGYVGDPDKVAKVRAAIATAPEPEAVAA